MASVYGISWSWSITTPITSLGNWQVLTGAQQDGLLEFNKVVGTVNLVGATGGTLDVVIQTNYGRGLGQSGAGYWKDICRFTQLTAGNAVVSNGLVFTRGIGGTLSAPTVVNTLDGPAGGYAPTIAANTILPQALGDALRVLVNPGAGTSAGALLTFAFDSSP